MWLNLQPRIIDAIMVGLKGKGIIEKTLQEKIKDKINKLLLTSLSYEDCHKDDNDRYIRVEGLIELEILFKKLIEENNDIK